MGICGSIGGLRDLTLIAFLASLKIPPVHCIRHVRHISMSYRGARSNFGIVRGLGEVITDVLVLDSLSSS